MRSVWIALIIAIITLSHAPPLAAQQADTPINLDFEAGPEGAGPLGWRFTGPPGASALATADAAHDGVLGLSLLGAGNAAQQAVVVQRVDARPYRGRRVRVSGMVSNTGQAEQTGHFWVRVDASGGRTLKLSNAPDVGAREWVRNDAVVDVSQDAEIIAFGFVVPTATSDALLRIDSVSLTALEDVNASNEPPAPLTQRGLENLIAFARLYGYVRYFHPSDEAASADWSSLLLAGVERVEGARSQRALRDALHEIFTPVAPSVRIVLASEPPPRMDLATDDTVAWTHRGLGGGSFAGRPTNFISARGAPSSLTPNFVRLSMQRDLVAYVPVIVGRDNGHTLPRTTAAAMEPRSKPDGWTPSGDDRTSRLAAVIEAWNIPQHFYPQMETQGVDWNAELSVRLREAARDDTAIAFDRTLARLALALRDAHAGVSREGLSGVMPFAWEWIEDRVIITAVGEGADAARPGDVLLAIDGRPIAALLAQATPIYGGATVAHARYNALVFGIMRGDAGARTRLTIERGGQVSEVDLRLASAALPFVAQPRPSTVADVGSGVIYVDLTRLTNADLVANLARMVAARAIVFDVRGYPTAAAMDVLPRLAASNLQSDQFNMPTYTQPDRQNVTYENLGWNLPPLPPRLRGAFVFMTDERATSYGESVMGVVENAALGPIVGSHTSGTNGNINQVTLLTGHRLSWTGLQVLRPDGSRRFGIGVLPTIPAHRTIARVRAGRDELLEAAIAAAIEREVAPEVLQ